MKKFFSFVAAVLFAGSMMAGVAEIKFLEDVAKDETNKPLNDSVFTVEGSAFTVTTIDPEGKMKIDANNANFVVDAEATEFDSFTKRLNVAGKSTSTKNYLVLNIPEAGTLRIGVRAGNKDAIDRNLVVAQGTDTLYNQIVKDADSIKVNDIKCFPYIFVDVAQGEARISYPVNGMYFYSFALITEDVVPAIPQYEVAEAIAAGLAEDAEIAVRGVITKMEFKGKNFAKYGSVNIYVADATGAAGEFEFYNCYSLEADTFRASVPAYDATSTAWAQFTEVSDGNGNTIHVGDTVIAHGNYTYFASSSMHELKQGCFLVDVKESGTTPEPPVVTVDTVTCAEVYSKAKNDEVVLKDVVVTFANGKNVWVKDETASMLIYLSADATWQAGDVLAGVAGTVDIYNGIYEVKPSADQAAAVVATPGEAPAAEVVATVAASDVNKYIVMKGVEAEGAFAEGTQSNITINGVTVRNQFKNAYTFEAGKKYDVYGVVTLYQNNPQVYFITAEEAKQEGIENVELTEKASKVVVNGMLYIIRDGKMFNATGAIVK